MIDPATLQSMVYLIGYGGVVGFGGAALTVLLAEGVTALFHTFKSIAGGRG